MDPQKLVPQQEEGIQTNTESHIELPDTGEAERFLKKAKQRLLDVNGWHQLSGAATARFQLTDSEGKDIDGPAAKGQYFKINIPGPGNASGDGNDWVRIESIEEDENSLGITVRPCSSPVNDRQDVAHFFGDSATSTFLVKKEGKKVTAGVYGRNEKPNTATETVIDKMRNAAVAIGAMAGFSKLQWKSLVNGIVSKD